LAIAGGVGGFLAVDNGFILNSEQQVVADGYSSDQARTVLPEVAFVVLEPLVISLPHPTRRQHLRFSAQLEVVPDYQAQVEAIKPRIVDVLNGYLRAVDVADLEDLSALTRLRAQMLRRIQVVTGPEQVRDLLIMEFILN
jgi:flagellar FliL protein